MPTPRQIIIANPGTPRCERYVEELRDFGWTDYTVVPWLEVIQQGIDDHPAFQTPAIVRIESPGKCEAVNRFFCETDDLPRGVLHAPGLWFRNFKTVLERLHDSFARMPHLRPTASPRAIAHMFDKSATAATLRENGLPTPDWMKDPLMPFPSEWNQVFIKLNTGASAVGIIAWRPDVGTATFHEIDGRFYNTRQLVTLRGDALDRADAFLRNEGAFIQRGHPKATIDGDGFDVRVVCIGGEPVASIFRLSRGPMTNLHLGGRRGDYDRCRAAIPTRYWLDGLDSAAAAAKCFDSLVCGVDLLFEPGFREHVILEVNAFGDFMPGWRGPDGKTIHCKVLEAIQSASMSRT